mgnify:CR=1 FL=1
MSAKTQYERIILGLKVKQLRQGKRLSFSDLSKQTQMSVSYLNEIEKGKKYPKEDKVKALAQALEVEEAELTSPALSKNLEPVAELLQSNFLNELPLDLFGIELVKVVEIIANAPLKVGAFISTLLELSRNYALHEAHFYFGALRSYLELHSNYFEDIEQAAVQFRAQYGPASGHASLYAQLKSVLERQFAYQIEENGLDEYPDLQHLRAIFVPRHKRLLLNGTLTPTQKSFQLGKELGFQLLQLEDRANTSSLLRVRSFEEVLSHSRATYFSVALHIPLEDFVSDMRAFFDRERWDGEALMAIMKKYDATPEMFFHRLTNVLPKFFGMEQLFFLRFLHDPAHNTFEVDKELHLSRLHHPHGNGLSEHYCRRWVAISLLNDLHDMQQAGTFVNGLVRAQRSHYIGTNDEYLCLTLARPGYPAPNRNVSVTLGLLVSDDLRQRIRFLDDPAIQLREVNKTCERCPLSDCTDRAAPPLIVEKRERWHHIQQQLAALTEG